MCGLAGRFNSERLAAAEGWAARAEASLVHRGPDGSGYAGDAHCELVHRRLAIIDLSPAGAQPMTNETGSLTLVFNGEIYNHAELRRELVAKRHAFRGTSDSEVIVHLYEEMGPRCVERLRGIFAFAIYDARARRLFLARDRFGVKPLFVAGPLSDGEWVFASELKAILAHPRVPRRIDRQACYDFLALGFVPEPQTGFTGIAALPPGGSLVVDGTRCGPAIHARTEAHPRESLALDEAVSACAAHLSDAVASQRVADVPVAALLSGGIDSALVVAAHRRVAGEAPATFNVGFADARFDESEAARAVARHCGAQHHDVRASRTTDDTDALLSLLRHFDQPFGDPSCIPTFGVARALRDHGYRCALSGDGGDEAFGGYPRFWQGPRLLSLACAPRWVREVGRTGSRLLRPFALGASRRLAKATTIANEARPHADADARADAAPILAGLTTYLSSQEQSGLVDMDARRGLLPTRRLFDEGDTGAVGDAEELSQRMTDALFRLTLPSDMLRKVDMMSMRAGVEVRVPMLDETLVDFGLSLPHRLKTDGRRGKLVLRAVAESWLPPSIARAPKHGFDAPLDGVSTPAFAVAIDDLVLGAGSRTASLFAPGVVRRWRERLAHPHDRGSDGAGEASRGTVARRLFGLLSLELWMRDFQLTW